MQIPHKVEIKPGVFYTVGYVDKFDDPTQLGMCGDKDEKTACRMILIKKGQTKELERRTFLHEMLHAIEFEYKIKIPHKVVYALEVPLLFILMSNPTAFAQTLVGAARRKGKRKRA